MRGALDSDRFLRLLLFAVIAIGALMLLAVAVALAVTVV
jgi:hypothetical protein